MGNRTTMPTAVARKRRRDERCSENSSDESTIDDNQPAEIWRLSTVWIDHLQRLMSSPNGGHSECIELSSDECPTPTELPSSRTEQFTGGKPPISLRDYVQRILKYADFSAAVPC